MKSVWNSLLGMLGSLALLVILSLPLMSHGFLWRGNGMMTSPRSGWRTPMHGDWTPMMDIRLGGMGSGALQSGLIQLGLLAVIVLGIIWLLRAAGRKDRKSS